MDVQDAVRQSVTVFGAVFPTEMKQDWRLEEVVLSDDEEVWRTTISFRNPDQSESAQVNNLAAMLGSKHIPGRIYKMIEVRATDGRLLGIVNA